MNALSKASGDSSTPSLCAVSTNRLYSSASRDLVGLDAGLRGMNRFIAADAADGTLFQKRSFTPISSVPRKGLKLAGALPAHYPENHMNIECLRREIDIRTDYSFQRRTQRGDAKLVAFKTSKLRGIAVEVCRAASGNDWRSIGDARSERDRISNRTFRRHEFRIRDIAGQLHIVHFKKWIFIRDLEGNRR